MALENSSALRLVSSPLAEACTPEIVHALQQEVLALRAEKHELQGKIVRVGEAAHTCSCGSRRVGVCLMSAVLIAIVLGLLAVAIVLGGVR